MGAYQSAIQELETDSGSTTSTIPTYQIPSEDDESKTDLTNLSAQLTTNLEKNISRDTTIDDINNYFIDLINKLEIKLKLLILYDN